MFSTLSETPKRHNLPNCMRIGIFGGTFDPPHNGHLAIANAARTQLELDEVLFVPSNRNPLKAAKTASARDRMEMVRRAIQNHDGFAVSDIEIARGGPSYAYDTLSELLYMRPADYWWIMGSDAVKDFERWKHPDKLSRLCRIAVAVRPPSNARDVTDRLPEWLQSRVDVIKSTPSDISSTDIRLRIGANKAVANLLPSSVLDFIHERKLYRI